jgi:hypothetical protein
MKFSLTTKAAAAAAYTLALLAFDAWAAWFVASRMPPAQSGLEFAARAAILAFPAGILFVLNVWSLITVWALVIYTSR